MTLRHVLQSLADGPATATFQAIKYYSDTITYALVETLRMARQTQFLLPITIRQWRARINATVVLLEVWAHQWLT